MRVVFGNSFPLRSKIPLLFGRRTTGTGATGRTVERTVVFFVRVLLAGAVRVGVRTPNLVNRLSARNSRHKKGHRGEGNKGKGGNKGGVKSKGESSVIHQSHSEQASKGHPRTRVSLFTSQTKVTTVTIIVKRFFYGRGRK